jgi:hypothetical protein
MASSHLLNWTEIIDTIKDDVVGSNGSLASIFKDPEVGAICVFWGPP